MSISTQKGSNRIPSPVKYYVQYKGSTGVYTYWDGEKNVELEDIEFVVMDTRSSISGWSDDNKARIYSNMVRTVKDELVVRCGKTELVKGPYETSKDKIKSSGGKFTTNIFAMATIDGIPTPVDIQFSGACLRDWSTFVEKTGMKKLYSSLIKSGKGDQQKKGAVKYYTPTFTLSEASEADLADAKDFDENQLQPYLTQE